MFAKSSNHRREFNKMADTIYKSTVAMIAQLYQNGNLNRVGLASFRNANSIKSPIAKNSWPLFFRNIPAKGFSKYLDSAKVQTAIFSAVHLYAIHQQGETQCVYGSIYSKSDTKGVSFFQAISSLSKQPDDRDRFDRRIQILLGLNNIYSTINALNHLVNILKASGTNLKIDYPQMAADLYSLQKNYQEATKIHLKWGEQYFREVSTNRPNLNKGEQSS